MSTIRAIYENGVFRPVEALNLPERIEVTVNLPEHGEAVVKEVDHDSDLLTSFRFKSGSRDLAARHDEHQP